MEVKWALVLALLCLFVTTETFAKRGYLMTAPRTFRTGVAEKLRVQLFDTKGVWIVKAKLYQSSSSRKSAQHQLIAVAEGQFTAQKHGILTLKVPENLNILWKGKNGKLVISATNRKNITTMNEKEVSVTIEKRQPSLFIQTDKPIYKPGQEVRMRIIGTDPDLKPLTGKVTRVSIMTPSRVRIMQWDNQSFVDGIVSLKMKLSKQPVLGLWKIEALVKDVTVVQTIKIDKYVLPKFQVTIKPPSYVAVDSREVIASICATYTYGQPVQGTVEAKFTVTKDWRWTRWHRTNTPTIIEVTKEIKGCQDFRFSNKELGLFARKNNLWGLRFKIEATVTEGATGVSRNATSVKLDIVRNRIQLRFTPDTPRQLKPGLPFVGKLAVTEPNGNPVSGENVTITARGYGGVKVYVYEKQYAVKNGLVEFTIDNVSPSTRDLYIQAKHHTSSDPVYRYWYYNAAMSLRAWYSPSRSFLSLDRQTKILRVGKKAQISFKFTANATTSPVTFYYSVMAKGELVSTGKIIQTFSPKGGVASGKVWFPVTQAMVPSCRLLVYYIRVNGETVADSMGIDVEDKLENQVSVRFDEKVKRPGETTQLIINAAPGSRVAIAAVDKSVHLLRAANELTESKVISVLKSRDVGPTYNYRTKKCGNNWFPWRLLERGRRSIMPFFNQKDDSSKAFNDAGMIYITNLKVESAPCPKINKMPNSRRERVGNPGALPTSTASEERTTAGSEDKPTQVRPKIRQEFPETWLWTEERVNKNGEKIITAPVPDTITSWYASGFAMSQTRGIGVASPASLTVFQPFFVSLTLPYSVIRGEQLTVIATVFNYMSRCLTIQVSIESTQDFRLTSGSTSKLCVCGNEAKSVNFTIVASKLGRIPLTVTGRHVQQSLCSNSSIEASVGLIDTVRRKLLVEPEGVRKEYTFSKLVCPRDSRNGRLTEKINLTLPQSVVPGSVYATLSAIGDLMGPALSGLDNLLRMPMGCGEQNMVLFAPNIYVLQYLKRTRQLTAAIRAKAIQFLQIGYQRELTYKRRDGSYSAFGNSDEEGSLWLTAFVLRSFAQARQFIYVDENELKQTIQWLKSKQTSEGCFPKHGKLFNKAMKGGVTSPVTLTAFTVLALLEAGVSTQDRTITQALDNCIMSRIRQVKDSYSLALLAYTFAIANHPDKDIILKKLQKKAIVKDGLMHWEQETSNKPKNKENIWISPYYRAPAADIEMTAYALMATIASGSRAETLRAIPIVRWLSTQRNGLGGFQSTQDTCVGLMSLAQFAAQAYDGGISLTINVQGQFSHSFSINDRDRLVLKRAEIPSRVIPTELTLIATGSGCALVQADVSYYVPKVIEKPAFNLTVDVRRRLTSPPALMRTEAGGELCVPLEMHICARWLKKGTSNMAIVRVKLVSGFRADEESLDALINLPSLSIKKYEIEGQEVNVYFDEIEDVCFSFGILQETVVEKTKPAAVTVYDYYEPALSATKLYEITEDLCHPDDS